MRAPIRSENTQPGCINSDPTGPVSQSPVITCSDSKQAKHSRYRWQKYAMYSSPKGGQAGTLRR